MKIGAAALAGIVLMVCGLILFGVADLRFGGYVAVIGLFVAMGAVLAAHLWAWRHDDDFR